MTGRDPRGTTMEAFEYAIKKDVRNNPIVREVDEARQRELWKSVGVAGFLVLVLLFSAWQHFELLRHGYQVEEMQRRARGRGRDRPPAPARDRNAASRRSASKRWRPNSCTWWRRRATKRSSSSASCRRTRRRIRRGAAVMTTPAFARAARRRRTAALTGAPSLRRRLAVVAGRARRCGSPASRRGWSTCRSSSSADLVARAERQQSGRSPAPAKRGDIVDRRGRVLATSVDADTIYAVPSEIDDAAGRGREALRRARRLHAQGTPGAGRAARHAPRRSPTCAGRSRRIRRGASPRSISTASASSKESQRFYPNKELGAHLLGYVGIDNNGLGGLESAYDSQIRGKDGTILVQTDARRHAFSRVERPPTSGSTRRADDRRVPAAHRRARAARRRASRTAPPAARAIVMNPHTGEILAMANEPTFNPNAYRDADDDRAAQPRRAGSLRAGIDVQGRHRVGGDRREGHAGRRADRRQRRADPDRLARRPRHARLRRAVVHRRHRQVEQRRRDQDRLQARHRAAERLRPAVRIRPSGLARLSRRERAASSGTARSGPRARSRRCRWAIRSA